MDEPQLIRQMAEALQEEAAHLQQAQLRLQFHSNRLKVWTRVSIGAAAFNGLCALLNLAWLWYRLKHKV
jgi:hypothetical protein